MKKIITLLGITSGIVILHAQIGVNTPNPQGSFHIDGAKDNPETGTPNATQQANDIVVTSTGNMGIGTISPSVKLDINNGTTPGAIKIVDGTEGGGKALVSDGNGVGTWQPLLVPSYWAGPINATTPTNSFISVGNLNFRLNLTDGNSSTNTNIIQVQSVSIPQSVIISDGRSTSQAAAVNALVVPMSNISTTGWTNIPYTTNPYQDGTLSFNVFSYNDYAIYRVTMNVADGDSLGFGAQAFLMIEYFKK